MRDLKESPSLVQRVRSGEALSFREWLCLDRQSSLEELLPLAREVAENIAPSGMELCSIHNVRDGGCREDCSFCAQSSHWGPSLQPRPFSDGAALLERAKNLESRGVKAFSLVASGRSQNHEDFALFCSLFAQLREETNLVLCASLGFLTSSQARRLREAGVSRYHHNLESAASFYPHICSTHTQEEKYETLGIARQAGLSLCSGGIIGLGESRTHRLELAFQLRKLRITSVPLNVLMPIPGTPLEKNAPLEPREVLRTLAMFRLMLPQSRLRLAGGRKTLEDLLDAGLRSCANGLMTGDYLTTTGATLESDLALLRSLGLKVVS